jgi:hypothetical protein
MVYNTSYNENVHSYVNNINTIEGGTHLAGFRRGLTRTLKKYAEDNKLLEKLEKQKIEIDGNDFRDCRGRSFDNRAGQFHHYIYDARYGQRPIDGADGQNGHQSSRQREVRSVDQ